MSRGFPMRFLGKVLIWLLWLLLLAAAFVLLTALSWWMKWPLATGGVLLLGVLGLVLVFFGVRALYRWRDKRRFVRKVMDEQAEMEEGEAASVGRMAEAWQTGMDILMKSPLRFHQRVQYSQPWFLTLDETGGMSSLFRSLGNAVPRQEGSPLYWHFLSQAVLLHCQASEGKEQDWEELLASLARNRRRMPLRGMVILLSLSDLEKRSDEELAVLGQRLRSRSQQVMLSLNRRYPVYVFVQGLESLPGMNEVMSVMPSAMLDQPLGLLLAEEKGGAGRLCADSAARTLENAVRTAAAGGELPHGDMLKALRDLRLFGERLEIVLEGLTREVAHQVTPILRGVFFCPSPSAEDGRPKFMSGLLSRVLPSSAKPTALSGGLPFYASTKVVLMTAWLTLMLFVCGLFAVNAIYQHHVLTVEAVSDIADVSHDDTYNRLYKEMLYARRLEQARKAWFLPTLGGDMLLRVEQKVKAHFVVQVNAGIMSPMLSSFQSFLTRPSSARDDDAEMDVFRELIWLCSAISDRVSHGSLPLETQAAFPVTRSSKEHWSPVMGQLIINALNWTPDGEQLDVLSQNLRSLLTLSFTRGEGNLLNTFVVENVNRNMPGSAVCTSQFWPHLGSASADNLCIPPAYTAAGYAVIRDTVQDLEYIAGNNQTLHQELSVLLDAYFKRYAGLWQNFAETFSEEGLNVQQGDVFSAYADVTDIMDVPHMRLLHAMASELAPMRDAKNAPAWISRFWLTDAMAEVSLIQHKNGVKGSHWKALLSVVGTSPQLLQRLRAETQDAGQLRELLLSSEYLHQYLDKVVDLLHTLSSPSKSLELAAAHYATRGTEKPENSPYTEAEKNFTEAFRVFRDGAASPARTLLSGMLDFIAQGTTVQAARMLQQEWESDVLSSPAALYRQDDVEALFGSEGVVQTFVSDKLKPFLTRQDRELVAARWGRLTFPFTTDFLSTLSRAEIIAADPPKDTFYVLLRSQPTLVNVDAKVRPDSTELTLQCQGRENRLVNRNYPRNEKFQYSAEECGAVSLELRFPAFTLTRSYASFTEFLRDFAYGERVFGPEDFPDEAEDMKNANLRQITVRILPDNVADVLRHTDNLPPELPDRITYVW